MSIPEHMRRLANGSNSYVNDIIEYINLETERLYRDLQAYMHVSTSLAESNIDTMSSVKQQPSYVTPESFAPDCIDATDIYSLAEFVHSQAIKMVKTIGQAITNSFQGENCEEQSCMSSLRMAEKVTSNKDFQGNSRVSFD